MSKKLTKGQASCLVLDMIPTKENRKLAKSKMESIGLTPTYTNETSSMEPLGIAATLQSKNPFKYMDYDDTPPSSPCHTSVKRSFDQIMSSSSSSSSESSSTDEFYKVDITKDYILDVMRVLLVLKDPNDKEKYEEVYFANEDIWNLLNNEIDGFGNACKPKQLIQWVSNDGTWGQSVRQQVVGSRSRGRYLFLLKSQYRANAINNVKNINLYRASAHVEAEKWKIVGYARKSNSNEDDSTRQRLLSLMIKKLKTKMFCCKVFVSPNSNSDTEFEKRDQSAKASEFVESLKCDGTTEASETRKVRLVAIDYAGLSTNLEDLRSFVSKHKCIKEVVIDRGHRVEVYERKQILKNDQILSLFRCRVKAVNRSN